jgi:hypothetical protein
MALRRRDPEDRCAYRGQRNEPGGCSAGPESLSCRVCFKGGIGSRSCYIGDCRAVSLEANSLRCLLKASN